MSTLLWDEAEDDFLAGKKAWNATAGVGPDEEGGVMSLETKVIKSVERITSDIPRVNYIPGTNTTLH